MSNDKTAVYIGNDTYRHSDPEDGLYEKHILCADCDSLIGAWSYVSKDGLAEVFFPYWMLDEDNNNNVCESCHE